MQLSGVLSPRGLLNPLPSPRNHAGPGLYAAPQTTGEALKGGRLAAAVMQGAGYGVTPASGACRPWSAITAIRLGSPHAMAAFASAVQASSPIGSYVTPTPGVTPGYADPVVFADGTFVAGSTSELGAGVGAGRESVVTRVAGCNVLEQEGHAPLLVNEMPGGILMMP